MHEGFEVDGIYVTPHAMKRMRQRLGLNRRSLEREVIRVLRCGVRGEEAQGELRRWVDKMMWKQTEAGTSVRLTTSGAFIIRGSTLVTVLPLNGRLVKRVRAQMEEGKDDDD